MAVPPSSRRGRRRSPDQIEEAWWAKQLGRRPEPAAAAEDKSEHRVSSEPETAPPAPVFLTAVAIWNVADFEIAIGPTGGILSIAFSAVGVYARDRLLSSGRR